MAHRFLKHTLDIYEVYFELMVINLDGDIVATAKNQQLLGQNMATHDWFEKVRKTNEPYVTDLYYSETIRAYTINYSSPIHNERGELISVMSTRFNWQYVMEIVSRANLGDTSHLYIINQQGDVIASKRQEDILNKNLRHFKSVQKSMTSHAKSGYEMEQNDLIAYSKSEGYNAYKGKGWTAIVIEKMR